NTAIPGHELAGVVTALGYGTTGLSVGQRVFGLADWYRDGTLAEYVAIEARNLAPLPGESEFVLLGFERDTEDRPFAHVGQKGSSGLEYAGMAFMTFGEKLHSELSRKAEALCRPACAVNGLRRPRATWLTPEIRVRVRHLRNGSGLRHASVRAILGRD